MLNIACTVNGLRNARCIVCLSLICIGYWAIMNSYTTDIAKRWVQRHLLILQHGYNDSKGPGLILDTDGCKISDIDPFDPVLKVFYKKLKPYIKKQDIFSYLIYTDKTTVYLNKTSVKEVLKKVKAKKEEELTCCISYFKILPVEKRDGIIRYPDGCEYFTDSINITDEYMKINCFAGKRFIYEKVDFRIMRKPDVEARCRNILKNAEMSGTACEDQLSVVIFGIDSVSRLDFQRQLPETRKILLEEMGAIELMGYNKAGEYTFVCLMPLLSGMTAPELEKQCGGGNQQPFDKCRLLWDVFGAAGYRTAYVENMNYYGLFTNRQRKGFLRLPADYYGRVFYNVYESKVNRSVSRKWRNLPNDETLFQWAMEFHEEFQNDPHFGHFWISIFSHNVFNEAQHVDPILSRHLQRLKNENMINNTLIIVMSDHGMRFGNIRQTNLGILEEKLPSAFFVFPRWFQERHREAMRNFRQNARNRFTTAFDIHQTLEDLAHCKIPATSNPEVHRGISLFADISPLRTCTDAGIEESYCSCRRREFFIWTKSALARNVTRLVFKEVEKAAAKREDLCAKLKMRNITMVKAETEVEDSFITKRNKRVTYTVTFFTKPGDGHFEGTVYYDSDRDMYTVDENIRRINKYGKTSDCVQEDPVLKTICFCHKQ